MVLAMFAAAAAHRFVVRGRAGRRVEGGTGRRWKAGSRDGEGGARRGFTLRDALFPSRSRGCWPLRPLRAIYRLFRGVAEHFPSGVMSGPEYEGLPSSSASASSSPTRRWGMLRCNPSRSFAVAAAVLALLTLLLVALVVRALTVENDPDLGLGMIELVQRKGYAIEMHEVTTPDGYILGVYRIPRGHAAGSGGGRARDGEGGAGGREGGAGGGEDGGSDGERLRPRSVGRRGGGRWQKLRRTLLGEGSDADEGGGSDVGPSRRVVFLQHGLLDSSLCWVINPPSESLAFILADAGYDVWMGNNRGNALSLGHVSLDHQTDTKYWDFSFDEFARQDLPSMLEYALRVSEAQTLAAYIGHSQGSTQAFAAFSRDLDLASAVELFVALAPVTAVGHQKSPVFNVLAKMSADEALRVLGVNEFMPQAPILQRVVPEICQLYPYGCELALAPIVGPPHKLNETRIPVYMSMGSSGTSVKNIRHWAQAVREGEFREFDYGCKTPGDHSDCENWKRYGQKTPKDYDIGSLGVPVALFYGSADLLADPRDVKLMVAKLTDAGRDVVVTKLVQGYSHLDFTWGMDAHKDVYGDVIALLARTHDASL